MEDIVAGDYIAIGRGRADFGTKQIPVHQAYLLGLAIADGLDERCELATPGALSSRAESRDRHDREHLSDPSTSLRMTATAVVPDDILQGDRDSVRAFLRGYFDGDGVANPIVACNTSSRVLAEQIQQLLIGLGVFCGIRTRTSTQGLPSHMVSVYDIEAFEEQVGFTRFGRVKDRFYDNSLGQKRNPNHDLVPGVGALVRELAQHIPAEYLSNDFRTISAYYDRTGWRRPSYHLLRRWLAVAPSCPAADELRRIVEEHRAWTPVTEITPSADSPHRCASRRQPCVHRQRARQSQHGRTSDPAQTVVAPGPAILRSWSRIAMS